MSLFRAASTVSLLTLASRITGLVREQLVAGLFGANALTDAFWVAFRIPNLLRRLFAEGAFSQAFVPLLAATRARDGDEATHRLVDAVASVLLWALVLTCIVGVLGAPALVWLLASGLLVPQFRAWGVEPIYALAAGVMVGGVLQLAVQAPALRSIGMVPRLAFTPARFMQAWRHDGVHRVLRQMAPALLGVSVAQLSLLINLQIASYVAVGAVSWLNYADRLMEFPTALLGVALGVVLTPQLSAAQARDDVAAYS